jgi:hypothetical protein
MICRQLRLAVLTGLFVGSSAFAAIEVNPGVGVGLEYTDNAGLTSDNEDDDVIAVGYVGAEVDAIDGPFTANASASLVYENYTSNTFSDQYYWNLGAIAGWEMIRDRLTWQAQNYFTQQPRDSLDADTPDNRQNTNVFTFGPIIQYQVTPRNRISINPEYRNFWYEHEDTDSQQYGLTADWLYDLYRTMNVGLSGNVRKVDYDNEDRNPNFVTSTVGAVVSGVTSKSDYNLKVGATYINRDRFDNQDGFVGSLRGVYRLTGRSSIDAYLSSELTDSSNDLLNSETDPGTGDFSNEQISGDVLRNNTARLSYTRQASTLNADVWAEYRDLSYKESPDDRDVRAVGAELIYQITPLFNGGVSGSYNRTKEKDTGRKDEEYIIGGNLEYDLTSKLRTRFDIRYRDKDSTRSADEYSEFSAFISLVYGFADDRAVRRGGL